MGVLSSWVPQDCHCWRDHSWQDPTPGHCTVSRLTRPAFLGKRPVGLPRGAPRELWGGGGGGGTPQPVEPTSSYRRGGAPISRALTLAAATRRHVSTPGPGARHRPSGSTGPKPAEKVLNQLPPPAHSRRQCTPELIFLESSQRLGPWGLKAGAQSEWRLPSYLLPSTAHSRPWSPHGTSSPLADAPGAHASRSRPGAQGPPSPTLYTASWMRALSLELPVFSPDTRTVSPCLAAFSISEMYEGGM